MVSYNWQQTRELHSCILTVFLEPTSTIQLSSLSTAHFSCLPSAQLTLPEGTQPRWGHTLTSCRMGESRIHVTTFGGSSNYYMEIKASDIPKLADTTVLEFGEQNTFHFTIYWVVCSLTLSYCVNQLNSSLLNS